MKVWVNRKFPGIWPVGASAVVVAVSSVEAAALLQAKVTWANISPVDFEELDTTTAGAYVLNDGDY